MSRTRTLLQLRARIRKLADTDPDGSDRHTDDDVNAMINESWQAMRRLVSDKGQHLYLKPSTGSMTVGPLAGYSFGAVSLPADCVSLYGFDVTVSANDIRSLGPVSFSERNEFMGSFGLANGIPCGFHIYNVGVESTTTVTAGKIAILPAPDRAYPYTLWYLPAWVDITDDTYVFDGVAGWDDWVAWDVVLKLAAADNDMAQTAAIATQERAKAEEAIVRSANSVQRVGPSRRIDTAGMRRRDRADSRRRY